MRYYEPLDYIGSLYHYPVDVLIQYNTNIWIIHCFSKLTMVAVVDDDDDDEW